MAFVAAATSAVVGNLVGGLFSSGGSSGGGGGGSSGGGYDPALTGAQANAINSQTGIATDLWNWYKNNVQPNDNKVIAAGADINSPEAVARMQGQVNADQTQKFDAARKAAQVRQAGFGVNPASPAATNADNTSALAEASSKAGAINAVKPTLDAQARQYNFDVSGLYRGLPASSQSGFGAAATSAGNAINSGFNRGITSSYMQGQAAAPFVKGAQQWFAQNPVSGWGSGSSSSTSGYGGGAGGTWSNEGGSGSPSGYGTAGSGSGYGYDYADGGPVDGPGTGTSDSVPAAGPDDPDADDQYHLSDGEYIIPADVVRAKGEEFFDKLVDQYHTPVNRPNPGEAKRGFGVGMADGGPVARAGMDAQAQADMQVSGIRRVASPAPAPMSQTEFSNAGAGPRRLTDAEREAKMQQMDRNRPPPKKYADGGVVRGRA